MGHPSKRAIRFVRALLTGDATVRGDLFVAAGATLPVPDVRELMASGVLIERAGTVTAAPEARGWLKRALIDADAFAAQHRIETTTPEGLRRNLSESPLARLAAATDGQPAWLERHHVEAGERVRRLAELAQLQPRVTMSYSATHTASSRGAGHAAEITDMAAEARRQLAEIHRVLPRDCAGVVLDVCGLLKGLQEVERDRQWPRRSAKLVLRIGLEQLAQHYGIGSVATGMETHRRRNWLGEDARPTVFG